jgi:transposase-like protein
MSLKAAHFQNDEKARQYLEAIRWPNGPVCPHCGSVEKGHYRLEGKAHRPGLLKCKDCGQQFSVTVGTVFERSKIGLSKWLQAAYLMASSKKGMSAHQLHRTIGVTYKTAWFMAHRIRLAMTSEPGGLLGSGGQIVEADETYIGRKKGRKVRAAWGHKNTVLALVERGGPIRTRHVTGRLLDEVRDALKGVSPNARMATDEANAYAKTCLGFAEHMTVKHSMGEYVRGEAHINTLEGYFSVLKRGMKGVYQHCGEQHLHRYLSEFEFRYNNRSKLGVEDAERTQRMLAAIAGKRLTYRRPDATA